MNILKNRIDKSKLNLIKYSQLRIKESKIRKFQEKLLQEEYNSTISNLIIFLTPGNDIVNGGILSISSIYEETKKLKNSHNTDVILCTVPGDPPLLKYTQFKNQNYIYDLSSVLSYFLNLKKVIIHIPEIYCGQFLNELSTEDWKILENIENLHINIMMQNIELVFQFLNDIRKLSQIFENVTGTIAHEKYSNKEIRDKMGFPLHKLSTFISPERYDKKDYDEKEDILLVSPDHHPMKSIILELIGEKFPNMKIQIIEGLKYEEYKELISKAKWSLTFGEGLDGYFIEPIFSGSISFSVYNSQFFTKDFKSLKTVYTKYEELIETMPSDISFLDHKKEYINYQTKQFKLCTKYYHYETYIKNLESFYKKDYTFK